MIAIILSMSLWCFQPTSADTTPRHWHADAKTSTIVAHARASMHSFEAVPLKYTCSMAVDPKDSQLKAVNFAFAIHDLRTDNDKRDKEMFHWLESETYPELGFEMTRFEPTDVGGTLYGNVHLHGQTVPINFPVVLHHDDHGLTLDATFTLNTTDFGLPIIRKMGFLKVKPELKVEVHLEGSFDPIVHGG